MQSLTNPFGIGFDLANVNQNVKKQMPKSFSVIV
jgi:hypothetical protein